MRGCDHEKIRDGGGEREMKMKHFLLRLAWCITFWPHYSLSCADSLMFNYWKHSSSPSPAKQYPTYISSRHHLTDGNIRICWWRLWERGVWEEGGGGQESMGMADCCHHETFSESGATCRGRLQTQKNIRPTLLFHWLYLVKIHHFHW